MLSLLGVFPLIFGIFASIFEARPASERCEHWLAQAYLEDLAARDPAHAEKLRDVYFGHVLRAQGDSSGSLPDGRIDRWPLAEGALSLRRQGLPAVSDVAPPNPGTHDFRDLILLAQRLGILSASDPRPPVWSVSTMGEAVEGRVTHLRRQDALVKIEGSGFSQGHYLEVSGNEAKVAFFGTPPTAEERLLALSLPGLRGKRATEFQLKSGAKISLQTLLGKRPDGTLVGCADGCSDSRIKPVVFRYEDLSDPSGPVRTALQGRAIEMLPLGDTPWPSYRADEVAILNVLRFSRLAGFSPEEAWTLIQSHRRRLAHPEFLDRAGTFEYFQAALRVPTLPLPEITGTAGLDALSMYGPRHRVVLHLRNGDRVTGQILRHDRTAIQVLTPGGNERIPFRQILPEMTEFLGIADL